MQQQLIFNKRNAIRLALVCFAIFMIEAISSGDDYSLDINEC